MTIHFKVALTQAEIYLITLENKIWRSLGCQYFPHLGVIKDRSGQYKPVPRLTQNLDAIVAAIKPWKIVFITSKGGAIRCILTGVDQVSHTGTATYDNYALALCRAYEKHLARFFDDIPEEVER